MARVDSLDPPGEPGIRFGIANAALVLAVAICASLDIEASWALLLLTAVVVMTASGTSFVVGGRHPRPFHPFREALMADLAFIAVTGLFFLVAILVLRAVERL